MAKEGTSSALISRILLTSGMSKELDTTPGALSLAFIAMQPQTSTVILGASSTEQLLENLKAVEVVGKLKGRQDILDKVEALLGNKPSGPEHFGRMPLDQSGR